MKLTMNFIDNKTGQLWQRFMPRRKEITNNVSSDLISLQVYPADFDFSPGKEFTKWAAIDLRPRISVYSVIIPAESMYCPM